MVMPEADGILLDISMPILDGFTVLKMIRDNGWDIPVILMTAGATKENVEHGMKYNISGFFGKPFNQLTEISDIQFDFTMRELEIDAGRFAPDYFDLMNRCRNQIMMFYRLIRKE